MKQTREMSKALAVLKYVLKLTAVKIKAKTTDNLAESILCIHEASYYESVIKNIAQTPASLFGRNGKIDKRRYNRYCRKKSKEGVLILPQ